MFGLKKHDDQQAPTVAPPVDPNATPGASREAFSLDEGASLVADPIPFSDKDPEERLEETLIAQANTRKIREETHALVSAEHPEVEREDTVDKAHERGEL